jgi:16S rRNA (uracil1498-N3)-methyltransferase
MSTTRRFLSDFDSHDRDIIITGEEFFHLKKVLRAKAGDPIEVINGRGKLVYGEIQDIFSDRAMVKIQKIRSEKKPPVTIMVAPSLLKKKPMNQLVEKLSEIGVDEIRPVVYHRSESIFSDSEPEKWQKITLQSLKVNDRLWMSEVFAPVRIEEILAISWKAKTKIFLDLKADQRESIKWIPPVITLIGPPGDFTDDERELMGKNGFWPFRINECTLRTETAAISISAILKFKSYTLREK